MPSCSSSVAGRAGTAVVVSVVVAVAGIVLAVASVG